MGQGKKVRGAACVSRFAGVRLRSLRNWLGAGTGLRRALLLLSAAFLWLNPSVSLDTNRFSVSFATAWADSVEYGYDELGRVTQSVNSTSGQATFYKYDAAGNITSVKTVSLTTLAIESFSPSQGPVGTSVTIGGTGFSTTPASNTVKFNGTTAVVSSATVTQLVVTVPNGASTGPISVTKSGTTVTSSGNFTVLAGSKAPTITGFNPTKGLPGTAVTVSGTNFQSQAGNNQVLFNTTRAVVASATTGSIATSVPANATSGRIRVTTPFGAAVSANDFFVPPPGYSSTQVAVTGRFSAVGIATANLTTSNTVALMLFEGVAGQYPTLALSNNTISSAVITVYTPDGSVWGSQTVTPSTLAMQLHRLPATGTYSVLVKPNGVTGSVTLTLYQALTGSVTVDGPSLTLNLAPAGRRALVAFIATGGTNVTLNVTGNNFPRSVISIFDPQGGLLQSIEAPKTGTTFRPYLPSTGAYSILVDPIGAVTGAVTLSVSSTVPTLGIGSGYDLDLPDLLPVRVTFNGSVGQAITLIVSRGPGSTVSGASITVLTPSGETLPLPNSNWVPAYPAFDLPVLPDSGAYTLILQKTGTGSGAISVALHDRTRSISLASSSNPAGLGQPVTFSVLVTGASSRPSGTVVFKDGAAALATVTLNSGAGASTTINSGAGYFTTSSLALGSHSITAAYSGDAGNPAVSSGVLTQVIESTWSSATSIASTLNPANPGNTVIFTAAVRGNNPAGTVTFKDGVTTLGTGTLSAGKASFTTSSLASGLHGITAAYGGNSSNKPSVSPVLHQFIKTAATIGWKDGVAPPTTMTVNSWLTVTVVVSGAAPTGTVTILDNNSTLAIVPVLSDNNGQSGRVSAVMAITNVGARTLTAVYSGDAGNAPASISAPIQVNKATPVLSWITAPPDSMVANQTMAVRLKLVGAGTSIFSNAPTGTVTFRDGANVVASGIPVTVANFGAYGEAVAIFALTSIGPHTITAEYSGDERNSSGALGKTVTVNDKVAPTLVWETGFAPPGSASQNQLFTVKVRATGAGSSVESTAPTGSVTFWDGTTGLGTATLGVVGSPGSYSIGTATISMPIAGSRTITVKYVENNWNADGRLDTAITVTEKATPTIVWSAAPPASVTMNQSFTVQAKLTGIGPLVGETNPTGTVTFLDGGTTLGTVNLSQVGSPGSYATATLSLSMPTAGARTITVQYNGDLRNNTVSSNTAITVNNKATPTIVWNTAPPASVTMNQSFTVQAKLTGIGPLVGETNPTGTVTFLDGGTTLGTVNLSQVGSPGSYATATLSLSMPTAGARTITVQYNGDLRNNTVSSNTAITVNNKATPTIAWQSGYAPPASMTVGQQISVRAVVTGVGSTVGSTVPTGNVTFLDSGTALTTVNLSSGVAIATLTMPTAGSRTITAQYNGDPRNNTASFNTLITVNNKATPTIVWVTAPPTTVTVNQIFTVQVTVTGVGSMAGSSGITGTVSFLDDSAVLSTVGFTGGGLATATLSISTPGSRTISARYNGDASNAIVTLSSAVTVNDKTVPTVTWLNGWAPPASVLVNRGFNTQAKVTGTNPTGTFTFLDGSTILATSNVSSCCGMGLIMPTPGSRTITVQYSGDASNTPATLETPIQVDDKAPTTVTWLSGYEPPSSVIVNQSFPVQARVTGSSPTGTFTFLDGSTVLLTANIETCCGSLSVNMPTAGARTITARYNGDASNAPSTLNTPITVTKVTSSLAWKSGFAPPASVPVGQSFSVQAQVTGGTAPGTEPTGTVTFSDGAAVLATANLVSGTVAATLSMPTTGSRTITAQYGGNASNTSATLNTAITVSNKATPTISWITAPPGSTPVGQSFTVQAKVVGVGATAGSTLATGTVTFFDGASALTSAITLSGTGTASASIAMLTPGSRTISAQYSGDSRNTSGTLNTPITVNDKVNPTISWNTSPPAAVTVNQSISVVAKVVGVGATSGSTVPSGSVTFQENGTPLTSAILLSGTGTAAATLTMATQGSRTITAQYSGDARNNPGTLDAAVTVNDKTTPTISWNTAPPASVTVNQAFTLQARVTGIGPTNGSTIPTGTVTYLENGAAQGAAVTLSGGLASKSLTLTTTGSRTITAQYNGDDRNLAAILNTAIFVSDALASLSPTSVAFGNQQVSADSSPLAVTLKNTGTTSLSITGVSITGTNASDFAIFDNACPAALAAGDSCFIRVLFRPVTAGSRSASLQVLSNARNGTQTIPLTGTGTAATFSVTPTSLDFEGQNVGAVSAPKGIMVVNDGTSPLQLAQFALTGTHAADFEVSNNGCTEPVAAGGSCLIGVRFTPTAVGSRAATLQLVPSGGGTTRTVALSGAGLAPSVTVSPASLAYPNTLVGTMSAGQTATVTNSGTSGLTISGVVLGGAYPVDFSIVSNNCGVTVAPNQSCSIAIAFAPTAMGARTAILQVASDAANGAGAVQLSGTGIAPVAGVSPGSLTFANRVIGTTSTAQTVTVTNTGTSALNVSGVTRTGANPGDYIVSSNSCTSPVAVNQSCSIGVKFKPTAMGNRNATLQIASDANNGPQLIPLSGYGESTTPDAFSFTDVTGVARSTVQTSNEVTITGINTTVTVSVTGGTYSKNSAAYTSVAGTAVAGDKFQVRHTSSAAYSTVVNTVLIMGGISDTYTSTTEDDRQPDTFVFTDVTGVARSVIQTSNEVTIAGINTTVTVSVTGGTYSKNGVAFTSAAGTAVAGDRFRVQHTSASGYSTATNTTLTVGLGSDAFTSTTVVEDTVPNAFTFTDVTAVARSSVQTSNTITVGGINSTAAISVTSGSYSKNGAAYTTAAGTVIAGDSVSVRHTSSASYSTAVNTVLTMGGVSDTYTSTTEDDHQPDSFSFTDVTAVARSATQTSNEVTISGINTTVAVSVTGGTYSKNGGVFTSAAGTAVAGDRFRVQHTSAAGFSAATNTTLTTGLGSDTYTSTTLAEDTTPNAFTFTDVTAVPRSTVQTSNTITVTGINSTAAISVTGGSYSKNGGAYTTAAGTVIASDTVSVRHTSAAPYSTVVNTVLTMGGVSDTYTSTTEDDHQPDAFSFTDVTGVARSAVQTSNEVTIAGINTTVNISVTGGTYSKNGAAFTSAAGTAVAGDRLRVQHTSSSAFSTATNTTLTVGLGSDTFTSTTLVEDTTPNAFTFTDVTAVPRSTVQTSNTITVTGINSTAAISVTGGSYSKNGAAYTTAAGTVVAGNTVSVRHTSSASYSTAVNTVLTMGGVSDTYTSTTEDDYLPDVFTFTDVTGVARSAVQTANEVTIAGINTTVTVGVTSGSYSKNGGAFTSAAGTAVAGDRYRVQHTSASGFSTATNTTLTVGLGSDTFTSTTLAEDTTPNAFTFTDVVGVARSTVQTSNTITVTGINSTAAISVTSGSYSKNGAAYTTVAGTVVAGDTVSVRHTSSASYSTAVNTVLTMGGVSDTYTSTTEDDYLPDVFTFTDVTGVARSAVQTANEVTIAGINTTVNISVTGGTYSKNGAAFTSAAGTAVTGDKFHLQHTSASGFSTATDTNLTVGLGSDTFTSTTEAKDTTPNQFNFTDKQGVLPASEQVSNAVTISGINFPADVSVQGGEYQIVGITGWTAAPGTVSNGQRIQVRHTSAITTGTATGTTSTVGGVSDTFTSTTAGPPLLDAVKSPF